MAASCRTNATSLSRRPRAKGQTNSPPNWQLIENVAAAIERISGRQHQWTVKQNAMVAQKTSTRRRQVDVFVECTSGPRTFRVGVDVKHKSRPLSVEIVEQLCSKAAKLQIDRYLIVSTSGSAEAAREEAARLGVTLLSLEQISNPAFFTLPGITVPRFVIHAVDLVFPDGNRPSLEQLPCIELEGPTSRTLVTRVAEYEVRALIAKTPELAEGERLSIFVNQGVWQRTRLQDLEWTAPRELQVRWTLSREIIPIRSFRVEDDDEAITAIVPWENGYRQMTIKTIDCSPDGARLAISIGELEPPRIKV